jgi:hypothetical protein
MEDEKINRTTTYVVYPQRACFNFVHQNAALALGQRVLIDPS